MIPKRANKISKRSQSGETLLEVLIALVVLIIGSATATSLIVMAIKANVYNKDALVALNLAQEGLEYMRNVRDGNWIKFSANTQGCWNMAPGVATCAVGSALQEKLPGSNVGYALGDTLVNVGAKLALGDGTIVEEEKYRIKYFDFDVSTNVDGKNRNIAPLSDKADDFDFMGSISSSGDFVTNTKFYRSINIDYKNIGKIKPWAVTDVADGDGMDMMIVTSTVQWQDGGITHQTQLSSALTRYK